MSARTKYGRNSNIKLLNISIIQQNEKKSTYISLFHYSYPILREFKNEMSTFGTLYLRA